MKPDKEAARDICLDRKSEYCTYDLVLRAIEQARREGAEDMRERAAQFVETHTTEWGTCEVIETALRGQTQKNMSAAIRALPLD